MILCTANEEQCDIQCSSGFCEDGVHAPGLLAPLGPSLFRPNFGEQRWRAVLCVQFPCIDWHQAINDIHVDWHAIRIERYL